MMEPECAACRYWAGEALDEVGECRCNPPLADAATHDAYWPWTERLEWCGQFTSREQLTLSDIVLSPEIITKES